MELFQVKISDQGKLIEGTTERLSLVDQERGLVRTVREINETDDAPPQSPTAGNVKGYAPSIGGNFNNFVSPRGGSYPGVQNSMSSATTQASQASHG